MPSAASRKPCAMLPQKLGDLGVLSSKPSNGLSPETGVLVNGVERDAVDQT